MGQDHLGLFDFKGIEMAFFFPWADSAKAHVITYAHVSALVLLVDLTVGVVAAYWVTLYGLINVFSFQQVASNVKRRASRRFRNHERICTMIDHVRPPAKQRNMGVGRQ